MSNILIHGGLGLLFALLAFAILYGYYGLPERKPKPEPVKDVIEESRECLRAFSQEMREHLSAKEAADIIRIINKAIQKSETQTRFSGSFHSYLNHPPGFSLSAYNSNTGDWNTILKITLLDGLIRKSDDDDTYSTGTFHSRPVVLVKVIVEEFVAETVPSTPEVEIRMYQAPFSPTPRLVFDFKKVYETKWQWVRG